MKLLRDVAVRHLVTVEPSNTVHRAAHSMTDRGVGAAVVVEREQVVGIITERDVLRAVAAGKNVEATTVEDIMTRGVVSGAPSWDIVTAVKTMADRGFRHLLVMEMDEPIGIVSLRDLMVSMVEMIQPEDASA